MNLLDVLWHLLNLLAPGMAMGVVAASLAKLLWRRPLAGVPWRRLAGSAAGAAVAAALAGLVWTGRDGRMLTYVAMVLASAGALWWIGFKAARP